MTKVFPITPIAQAAGARHARLSPSSAYRWTVCTASPREEAGKPDESSEASRDGTVKHLIAADALLTNRDPWDYLGREVAFWIHPESDSVGETFFDEFGDTPDPGLEFMHVEECDEDRVQAAAVFVKLVREIVETTGGELHVEVKVRIGHVTGEPGATGTSDVVIVCNAQRRAIVIDLKGGRNPVFAYRVTKGDVFEPDVVTPNLQLALYAIGAVEEFDVFAEFETVTLMIVQPALDHVSEITIGVDALAQARDLIAAKAEETRTNPKHAPDVAHCDYCRALGTCSAVSEEVTQAVFALRAADVDGDSEPRVVPDVEVGIVFEKLDLIEAWCAALRVRVRGDLEAGRPVVGAKEAYRLAEGRMRPRRWKNPVEAERVLRGVLTDEQRFAPRKLISPTQVEALTKVKRGAKTRPPVGAEHWQALQDLIGQDRGRPVIVPASSSKPPPGDAASVDDFDDLSQPVGNDDPFTP